MLTLSELLSEIDADKPPQKIAAEYPWASISPLEREELFNYAERYGRQAQNLIRFIIYSTSGFPTPYKWEQMRATSLAIRHLDWDEERMLIAVQWIEDTLRGIKSSFSESSPPEDQNRYQRFSAEALVLRGRVYLEHEKINEAQFYLERGLEKLQRLGVQESVEAVEEIISKVKNLRSNEIRLLPLEEYEAERLRMDKILDNLQLQIRQTQKDLNVGKRSVEADRSEHKLLSGQISQMKGEKEVLTRDVVSLESCKKDLSQQIDDLQEKAEHARADVSQYEPASQQLAEVREKLEQEQETLHATYLGLETTQQEIQALLTEINQKKTEKEGLAEKIKKMQDKAGTITNDLKNLEQEQQKAQTTLNFLLALRKNTTAPLWVEVVRLALRQGQIDDLLLQAIERLQTEFHTMDDALLAEILLRTPYVKNEDLDKLISESQHWMALLRKAQLLKEQDFNGACNLIVEAWSQFLTQSQPDSN